MGRLKVARRAPSSSTSQVLRRADGKAVIASPCVKGALADSGLRQPSRLPAACSNVGERVSQRAHIGLDTKKPHQAFTRWGRERQNNLRFYGGDPNGVIRSSGSLLLRRVSMPVINDLIQRPVVTAIVVVRVINRVK